MAAPRSNSETSGQETPANTAKIEKGWAVYDALGRALGNVTEVNRTTSRLQVDGRAVGFEYYEVPLGSVKRAGGGDVHLSLVADLDRRGDGEAPYLFEEHTAPTQTAATETRPSTSTAGETAYAPTTVTSQAWTAEGAADAPPPTWMDEDSSDSWMSSRNAMAALAVAGLAGAGIYFWSRRRRKTPYERFRDRTMDMTGELADLGGELVESAVELFNELAADKRTPWLAGLAGVAATALPAAAYYAWPRERSMAETSRDRLQGMRSSTMAPDLGEVSEALAAWAGPWLAALSEQTPSTSELKRRLEPATSRLASLRDDLPSSERMMETLRPSTSGWGLALPAALLGAGAFAYYMSRRRQGTGTARLRDVMTRQPEVVRPDATITDAASIMKRLNVGALPVCDGSRLLGMLTDRDITIRTAAEGRDPQVTLVRDAMSAGVSWASEDDAVDEALRLMRQRQIRRLPVVDERHNLVGIVSLGDLVVDSDTAMAGDALEEISEPAHPRR